MGHAGAIIREGQGTVADKTRALSEAGAAVARNIADVPRLLGEKLKA
jgi:succinyl-CoA synthetase alpha subunit